jgi:hypothetical protein
MRLFILTILAPLLVSCANYGSERHFENGAIAAVEQAKLDPLPSERATVYYFRERAWLQSFIAQPIPPAYFGIDERLVSIMPVGSFVRLSLEPGVHTFSRIIVTPNWPLSNIVRKHELRLQLKANETYYVGSVNTFDDNPIRVFDAESGKRVLADTQLARIIHNPATLEDFMRRVQEPERDRQAQPTSSTSTSIGAQFSKALPTGAQVTSFLESLATVALAAVMLTAVVAGASVSSSNPQAILPYPTQRPAIVAPAPTIPLYVDSPSTRRRSDGSLAEILQSRDRLVVKDLAGGPSYTVEAGRIVGSDGSRYRVYNSTIISDTGQTYQVIGNNLFSSDGRSCTKTGIVVTCR